MKKFILPVTLYIALNFLGACSQESKPSQQGAVKTEAAFASLKMRSAELATSEEWATIQTKAQALLAKISQDPSDLKSKLMLAQLYMQEARVTGEHPYYYPATLAILEDVLKRDPKNFEAMAFKASVQLSLHHFAEALETGNKAKAINGANGFIYGVLCDANVELGKYDEAVKMSDMMQSIRPGLEAYSRASYLREIYGNNASSIEAMQMAYKAGLPGSEEASWAGYTLGHLYENTGDLKRAESIYSEILQVRPTYAFAQAGLARIEKNKGHFDQALAMLEKATQQMPEFSFYEDMADVYSAMGQAEKSIELYAKVITMLQEDATSGHYADMELALAYLHTGDLDNAHKHALIEYKRRPDNIDVNNTLAWVMYHQGDYSGAMKHIKTAMRMGTQNATLMYRAGLISTASGDNKTGAVWMTKATKINPYLPAELTNKNKKA